MTKPIILTPDVSLAQQECIDKLEEVLRMARSGEVYSLALVVCMHDGYATSLAGTRAADLNLGCDSLKRLILDRVEKRK